MSGGKNPNKCSVQVAIVGAGPYGLSIAAHLKAKGIKLRIFGSPMQTWLTQMPTGMRLKSEGFASSLSDPDSTFTLAHYCKEAKIPYADAGLPVALGTFAAYGLEFQKRFVPELENKTVVKLKRAGGCFELHFADGEIVTAQKVVIAAGISHFGYVPPMLSGLSPEFVSHSSQYGPLNRFAGQEVMVVGAGASALDVAALLHQAGASVQLTAREPVIRFHDPPSNKPRTLLENLRLPITGIGVGWKLFFYTNAPLAFRLLPDKTRLKIMKKTLGPAPGWFIKQDVIGNVPFNLGMTITQATVQNGKVHLELADRAGAKKTLTADHVIAATGYKVDLQRLAFLDSDIIGQIRSLEKAPVLSSSFESTVPGLYFVGTASANSFGPLMRFAFGSRFTALHISKHLARITSHSLVRGTSETTVQALHRG